MIGLNIKILRVEKQMTYDQFASVIKVSPRTLRRWEANERNPSIKHIKTIVDKFKIDDVYYFMFGDKPKEIPKLVYID
jgi:transcriptional regulator with XRE-family HTH domain